MPALQNTFLQGDTMTPTISSPQRRRGTGTRRPAGWALTALGTAAALSLSACAGSGVPPLEDVWPEAYDSIQDATSVAVDGTVTQGGQEMTVSIAGQIDDSSYAGDVSMDGVAIEIIGDVENTYMKPNTAFYEQNGGAQLQEMVDEKWLRMPTSEGGFTMSTLWESFIEDIPAGDEFGHSDYTSESAELDGEQVYKYTGDNEDTGAPVSVYLSQDNRLLRVEAETRPEDGTSGSASPSATASASEAAASGSPEGAGSGTIDFSRWNAVEPVEMPTEDEVFAVPAQ